MTLRRRLTFLVTITIVVPVTGLGIALANVLGNGAEDGAYDRLRQARSFAEAVLVDERSEVERLVKAAAGDTRLGSAVAAGGAALDESLRRILMEHDLDLAVVQDSAGIVAAGAQRAPQFAPGVAVPTDEQLVENANLVRALAAQVALPAGGSFLAGRWLDRVRLERVPRPEAIELLLVGGEGPIAATFDVTALPDRPLAGAFQARFGDLARLVVAARAESLGVTVAATSPPPSGQGRTSLLVLVGAVLVVLSTCLVIVGHVITGVVTKPVEDLVGAARTISRGDLSQRVDISGDVELATLGRAFNQMTDNLGRYVEQLEQSQRDFRSAIARLGDVLVSTHDLGGIIDVVLEACVLTLPAERAVFYERIGMGGRVRARAINEGEVPDLELEGTGVAGTAAREGRPVVHPGEVEPAPGEPVAEAAVAVPVSWGGRLEGVIALYDRVGGGHFNDDDLRTLETMARQAEVAIGNVYLHDETRRQARTDGTTGLWNRREFELRCREAVREASRFNESFGVILLDIDDFKLVNDRFDHSTGDAALIWLATRLSEATREIDVVARWGGEEFIALLPRAGPEETAAVAERIRSLIEHEPMVDGDKVIPLTVSLGLACHPQDGASAGELFRSADGALLRAKRMGKNRVEKAQPIEGAEV